LLLGIATRQVDLAGVEPELRAQIDKVCRVGISGTHFDGHKRGGWLGGTAAAEGIPNWHAPGSSYPEDDETDMENVAKRLGTNILSRSVVAKEAY
jgi:hypothetical protein